MTHSQSTLSFSIRVFITQSITKCRIETFYLNTIMSTAMNNNTMATIEITSIVAMPQLIVMPTTAIAHHQQSPYSSVTG